MSDDRELDVVVYGASGFTGRLVAEYLFERYGTGGDLKWALAGRSSRRVTEVLDGLGKPGADVPVIVADSTDAAALRALAGRTRVVLTTVGPYARHGEPLVAACVAGGTHYCDLAGEVQWMRSMIDDYQDDARESGARIVHACGFDSIPSDLGVWFLQQEARERFGEPCNAVSLLVRAMRGGMSGGTVDSLFNVLDESRRDRDVARLLVDPYSLNPEGLRDGPDGRDQAGIGYNDVMEAWTSPFVMALINQRVVRRTNALLDFPYGRDFRYGEAVMHGPGISGRLKAASAAAGLGAFAWLGSVEFTREQLLKRFLPEPGEGPGESAREAGFFNLLLTGTTPAGQVIKVRVTGDRDPGYGSTSKMIAESAVCLARDVDALSGGFWTPASAMNGALLHRLEANAGLNFEVL